MSDSETTPGIPDDPIAASRSMPDRAPTSHVHRGDSKDSPASQHRVETVPQESTADETPVSNHSVDRPARPSRGTQKY